MHFLTYYVNSDSKGWVFSALDCECSRVDIANALSEDLINQDYHDLLIANLHTGIPKAQSFEPV